MAVAWKEYWANSTPGTGALTIAPAANDFLIGSAIVDTNNEWAATPPTGWTEDADAGMTSTFDNGALYACSKVASGSETSITFAHQFGANFICNVASYSGVDTTTPRDVAVVPFASSVGGTTTDVNINPVTDGCGIAFVMGPDPGDVSVQTQTYTTQSGTTGAWTTRITQDNGFYKLSHGSCVQTTAGAITARCTTSITGGRLAVVYALRPAVPAGAMTGSISFALTTNGAMTGTGDLVSSVPVAFTQSGALTGTGALNSSVPVAFTSVGALTGIGGLSGIVPISFIPSGVLTGLGAANNDDWLVRARRRMRR